MGGVKEVELEAWRWQRQKKMGSDQGSVLVYRGKWGRGSQGQEGRVAATLGEGTPRVHQDNVKFSGLGLGFVKLGSKFWIFGPARVMGTAVSW
ncbi:hypothetical protein GOBAR_AA29979 [Gossypium barbadense]|uniref:Uncharacterized protein n=1 Tax=Gossypium barbadense TaxID=3634 RepID=A0A2P5WI05_GOSBA|nr:hypothetical protein GOBAR_AA29979 [Gossypium barbadense]